MAVRRLDHFSARSFRTVVSRKSGRSGRLPARITYNDNAMVSILRVLNDVARSAKVDLHSCRRDPRARRRQRAARHRVMHPRVPDHRRQPPHRVWCQQRDALTLAASAPASECPHDPAYGQRAAVEELIDARKWSVLFIRDDLQGIPRTVALQKVGD